MAFQKAKALQAAERSVAQGKILQAIKQYQDILDNDPSDVSLLNTMGDLYVRERNVTEALIQFHKLAEAYVQDRFNVKAIAIYRKISKVDPNSVDTLLKLGELYQLQGLSREAREQYLQAVDFFKKRNQGDRALEVLRKLVQLDPENISFRSRLAAECEQAGKQAEATQCYLESAEILLHQGNQEAAEIALRKAAELEPDSLKIQVQRARLAVARQEPEEAERIIQSMPQLQSDPAVKGILFDAYLATGRLSEAEKLAREVFRANPMDSAPLFRVSARMLESGEIDQASEWLADVADQLISLNNTGPLVEALRQIWAKAPKHIPTLELLHRVCERTADELTLPEVLETLGHVHEEAGDLEKAEAAYLKLVGREPENEHYHGLLGAVQQKLGRKIKPGDFSVRDLAFTMEEAPTQPAGRDVNQDAMVKEAIENSDLFARYNLPEKAIAELEKVLQVYPDQIEIHQRIMEISRKGYPDRGAIAAAQLARIYTALGDTEAAGKYHDIATSKGPMPEIPPPPPSAEKVEEPLGPPPAPPEMPEAGVPFPVSAPEEPITAAPALPEGAFSDLAPGTSMSEPPAPPPPAPVRAEQAIELDLSGDLEAVVAHGFEAPPPSLPAPAVPPLGGISTPDEFPAFDEEPSSLPVMEQAVPAAEAPAEVPEPATAEVAIPTDLEESKIEVEFYLENGFVEEARQSVAALEGKYPGHPFVARLRRQMEKRASEALSAQLPAGAVPPNAEPPAEVVSAGSPVAPPPDSTLREEDLALDEWELPTSYAVSPQSDARRQPARPPVAAEPQPSPSGGQPRAGEPAATEVSGVALLGDLARDLPSSLEELRPPPDAPSEPRRASTRPAGPGSANTGEGVPQLSGLLAEMEEPGGEAARDDPETHYNLGVAFREMGLLDEAIGEFQKVAKVTKQGDFPPNFLQACSLLAICFMEKKMPAVAIRWYLRALDTPGLGEEGQLALQYDLGLAYEQAGESRKALERFTEVYSQNIDFREVADKIRELQQKI